MSVEQDQLWVTLRSICEAALQSVAGKVAVTWPDIGFQSGHYSNRAFPMWFWGSFTNSLREHVGGVDISIDFKWGEQVVEVTADVARESGEILSEFPIQFIPLRDDGSLAEDTAREITLSVSDYVQEQWKLVGKALLA